MEGINHHVQQILDKVLDSPAKQVDSNGTGSSLGGSSKAPPRAPQETHEDACQNCSEEAACHDSDQDSETKQCPSLHFCRVCQVWISGDLNCKAHLAGRKHIKRVRLLEVDPSTPVEARNAASISEAPRAHWGGLDAVLMPVAEADKSMVPLYQCNLCGITATSIDHLDAHYRGLKHQKRIANLEMKGAQGNNSPLPKAENAPSGPGTYPGGIFACSICKLACSSMDNLQTHCMGRKHMKRVLQYNMESQKLGAYNGIAMERASSPYYHGNIGDMQHMAIPKMQTAHYTHPHVMMQHHMPHQHVAMMPCHTADIYAMHHPAAIMHTYVHGMYHAMPDMYFPLQHPSMYSQPPPPHWPPPNQPPPQYSYPYMQWNVQSPYPVSPHYFGYKAAEPIIQEVEAHEQDAAVRLEGFSAVTEPSGPSAIEAVTEFEADKSVLVATSDDSYDSAGSSPTTACIPECECPSKAPFPGTFDLPLAGEVPHDPLDASSSPARHYQQSSDHGMADTPQRQLHPEGETLLDEEGKPATPMRQTLNKLARQELSRLSFDFPADPASRRSQRWADDPSLGTFDKRPWSDDLCINGGPSRGPGSRRDSPALHHHTLSLDGSLDSFNSIFASSTAQMEVQERGVKILPIADLKALNTSLLKKYSPSAAPSSDVLLPPTCQSVEEAGGPCATFAASMSLRVGSATQSERQKQETYQTRLHQRSQSLSLPRGRGLVGRCLTAPMSEPLQVPVSMSSQGRGGFGFEDAGGMPSPLVVAPSSCGSGSSLACPLRHQRHQSMIVPGRNSQLCGDSSLPGGQCVPRPPLYHNLASGNPGGLLTGPSSNKGGGIWAMTESDRRRRSSSGSSTWEDNLGSNTPDGVSDPPKGPGDARSAGDCDEFSVPDGGQAGEEGVRDEDSSTAATWSALQPGSSAEHMFKANNPVFEDGEVAAGGVQAQRYYCNLCGINATSEAHLEAHYSGRRHQKNLANMYRGAPPPSETTRYHCPLCNVGATSEAHLEAHFRGKQHLRKLAAATGTSAVLPTYRCTLCGVTATSGDHLLSHFRGKQHQRKMQLAEQPPRNAQTPSEPFPPAPVPSWRQGRQQPLDGSRVMVPTIAPFSPVHIQPIMSSETWPMAGYIPPPPPPPPPSHHSWRRQDGVYAPHPFGGLRVPLRQWQGHQIPQRWER